ncbi:hypothetical protein TAMA11512_19330 [Selenomonas sp. TAMA-11512]|uniref:hypothetical protein n=1 Tax=Selenomonas sp. TAMA-11512 TaxID=3095337 RepID=UPI00308ECFC2|nr:hypothetical protein TAMA11512_19330 [Selenomonas sp. TAMA-11512]
MKSKKQFLLFLAVILSLLLCGHIAFLMPMRNELSQTEQELVQKREQLAGIRDYMNAHQDRASYEADLKRRSALVNHLLPDGMDTQGFLEELEKKAKQNKAVIHRVMPERPDENNAAVQQQFVSVEFTSNYFELLSFLADLEEGRFCKIREAHTEIEGGHLRTMLRLSIYALP